MGFQPNRLVIWNPTHKRYYKMYTLLFLKLKIDKYTVHISKSTKKILYFNNINVLGTQME